MPRILVLYAHPSQRHSRVNAAMATRAKTLDDITFVDLYAEYPRFKIEIDREQQRLLEHDIVVLQFPLVWYSTPSLLKEWQDLVLEYGFAYGEDGNKLAGKTMALAVTTGSSREAYSRGGYQGHELQDFLTPLWQTAKLCQMRRLPHYVLFDTLNELSDDDVAKHVDGYCRYLRALRDDTLKRKQIRALSVFGADLLPQFIGAAP